MGLVGNSIGMALKSATATQAQPAQATGRNPQKPPASQFEIVGLDPERQRESDAMRKYYSVDAIAHNLEQAVTGADLVIIATPLEAVREVMAAIDPYLMDGAVVTDVHPSKEQVLRWAGEVLGKQASFVGGHPIINTHKPDTRLDKDAPTADLFKDARWAIIPGRGATDDALNTVIWLAETVGATPLFIDPLEHDSFISAVSHMPVIASAALWKVVRSSPSWGDMQPFAQTSLRGITEPLAAAPEIITGALAGNRQVLIGWMDRYLEALYEMRDMLARQQEVERNGNNGNADALSNTIAEAHHARSEWLSDSAVTGAQKDAMRRAEEREEINDARPGRTLMGGYLSDRIFKKKDK